MARAAVLAGPCADCGEFEAMYFGKHPTLCRHCEPLNPRWRDHHVLPDEWVIRRIRPLFNGRLRGTWLHKAQARYALRHLHCSLDGQCVFRSGHRGCCYWGDDGE